TCIGTGVLIARGEIGSVEGTTACLIGIFVGDLLLYATGRLAGYSVLLWAPFARFLPRRRLEQAADWFAERGLAVVFLSRFTPGLRLPAYVAAGILRTRFWSFAGYFLIAASVWTPLLVGGTALLGEQALRAFVNRGLLPSIVISLAATLLLRFVKAQLPKLR
ncbi:MAG TPA: VTT domain-containing protein, partial [Bryobacteraceae bacterium]|nr:VTT domain-containing protein [Bryobacteraceae bacterium]